MSFRRGTKYKAEVWSSDDTWISVNASIKRIDQEAGTIWWDTQNAAGFSAVIGTDMAGDGFYLKVSPNGPKKFAKAVLQKMKLASIR